MDDISNTDLENARKRALLDALNLVSARAEEGDTLGVLEAAEAYAWLASPAQPHGASTKATK